MNGARDGQPAENWGPLQSTVMRAVSLALAIEGWLAVGAVFGTRSMDKNAALFGFSAGRVLAGAGFVCLALLFSLFAWRALFDPGWVIRVQAYADSMFLGRESRVIEFGLTFLYLSITGAYTLLLFHYEFVPATPYVLQVGVGRLFGGLVWLVSIPFQLLVVLMLRYCRTRWVEQPRGYLGAKPLLLFGILTAATLHWITLLGRAEWLYEIPGWFWHFRHEQLDLTQLPLVSVLLLVGLAVWYTLRNSSRGMRSVVVAICLAYFVQAGIGIADGQGFESLREHYIRSGPSHEMRVACAAPHGAVDSVKVYEQAYGDDFWLGTKPPGLLLFYLGFNKLVALSTPNGFVSAGQCFDVVTKAAGMAMPLLASLVMLPIYATERLISDKRMTEFSGFIYLSVPVFALMPLAPDQFLYPLIFMTGIAAIAKTVESRSFWWGVIAGFSIYLCVFVSFSMLAILGIAFAWLALDHVLGDRHQGLNRFLLPAMGICLGFAVLWVGIFLGAGYNPAIRLEAALEQHRAIKRFHEGIVELLQAALVNNVEFALWVGLSLLVLFWADLVERITRAVKRNAGMKDTLAVAFLVTFVALNGAGQTKGEVGRLWIFLVPLISILVSEKASSLLADRAQSTALVVALQLVTVALMFISMGF